jgi:uncharacterized membrane protein YeaQ/YmgE (transglycosylase-associated protein family)
MFAEQVITQRTVRVWFESHSLVAWLLLGLVAGWLAGKIARGRGFGCIGDILLGLIGSYIGGWIFIKLGILGGGFLYSLAAATLGAIILVSIAHAFSSSPDR